jgi:predicted enzyme related to lactoylglutathione lyase
VTPAILINIDVDDLDRAVAFYASVLERKVGRSFGAAGVELVGGSAPLYLLVKAAGTAVSSASSDRRSYARHWTPVHLDFAVPDLEKAVARRRRRCHAGQGARDARLGQDCAWRPFGHLLPHSVRRPRLR